MTIVTKITLNDHQIWFLLQRLLTDLTTRATQISHVTMQR